MTLFVVKVSKSDLDKGPSLISGFSITGLKDFVTGVL